MKALSKYGKKIPTLINPKYIYRSLETFLFSWLHITACPLFLWKKILMAKIYNLSYSKQNLAGESSDSVIVSNKSNYCYFEKTCNSNNFRKPLVRLGTSLKDRCSIRLWYTRHKDRKFFEPPSRISSPTIFFHIHKTLSKGTFKNFSPHFFFFLPWFISETLIQ